VKSFLIAIQSLTTMADSNTQSDEALDRLQGSDNQKKTIDPEDRRALNEALTDQATIKMMHEQSSSSKRKREKLRQEREAEQQGST
jgi:hypothetical protein